MLEPHSHVGEPRLRLVERVHQRADQPLDASKPSGGALLAHANHPIFHPLTRRLPKRVQRRLWTPVERRGCARAAREALREGHGALELVGQLRRHASRVSCKVSGQRPGEWLARARCHLCPREIILLHPRAHASGGQVPGRRRHHARTPCHGNQSRRAQHGPRPRDEGSRTSATQARPRGGRVRTRVLATWRVKPWLSAYGSGCAGLPLTHSSSARARPPNQPSLYQKKSCARLL